MRISRFKSYNEAFDKPYKWKLQQSKRTVTSYSFQDDAGDVFEVHFHSIDDRRFADGERAHGVNLSFQKGGSWEQSEGGTPFRVLATVYAIVKDYEMQGEDFLEIGMEKAEKSRVKLYNVMMKKLQKELKMPFWSIYEQHSVQFLTISRQEMTPG